MPSTDFALKVNSQLILSNSHQSLTERCSFLLLVALTFVIEHTFRSHCHFQCSHDPYYPSTNINTFLAISSGRNNPFESTFPIIPTIRPQNRISILIVMFLQQNRGGKTIAVHSTASTVLHPVPKRHGPRECLVSDLHPRKTHCSLLAMPGKERLEIHLCR